MDATHNTGYDYTKALVESYFYMMTKGCGDSQCSNIHCSSSVKSTAVEPNVAAAQSITWSLEGQSRLCSTWKERLSKFTEITEEQPETLDEGMHIELPGAEDNAEWYPRASTPRKKLVDALLLDHTISGMFGPETQAQSQNTSTACPNNGLVGNRT